MEIKGRFRFHADRALVWDALLEPAVLKAAIPGCERLDVLGPGRFDVALRVGIAAVRGTYRGVVTLSEMRPPDSYLLRAEGGGELGTAEVEAEVVLEEDDGATVVHYGADVRARGGLARLGSRVLQGSASMLLAQFFKAMDAQVARRVP